MKSIWTSHRAAGRATALVIGALLIVCWIAASGISRYYLEQSEVSPRDLKLALAWKASAPEALSLYGQRLIDDNPKQAAGLLQRAFSANPTDSHALIALARVWLDDNQAERADQAMSLAERLSPADVATNLQAAAYWLLRHDVNRALSDWDRALRSQSGLAQQLFPTLLQIAEQPFDARSGFGRIIRQQPTWWERFFEYSARHAQRIDTVRALYNQHQSEHRPLPRQALNAYISRLQAEGLWSESYIVWLNSLSKEQLAVLGPVYDGGFEQTRFEQGFDWHIIPRKGVEANAHSLFGGRRGKALQLVFHGTPVRGPIVEQHLLLLPGHYRLDGQATTDSLDAANGLVWTVSCANRNGAVLGDSERFVGTSQWRRFTMRFQVPAKNCDGQRIALQVQGTVTTGFRISGEAWFDDLAITLQSAGSKVRSTSSR